uniref:Reverse transcriptase domain-containing protein n=1 Tax=Cajanus cajan TaxID=3821 RepID=A0A151RSM0_CAJCA|nr:hypothetical protein KK1_032895 [Cajanus cajan]
MLNLEREKRDFIFKLDLEKAYDRVDRGFLHKGYDFGFPFKIMSLILHNVTSVSLCLL